MLFIYNIHLSMENFVETRGEIDLKYKYESFEYWKAIQIRRTKSAGK